MTENITDRPKPVVLVILDGWGIYQPYSGNAVTLSKTPVMNDLIARYPSTVISASGESVGLPWGEMGNSEVGHLNLGTGRIIYQDLPLINRSIGDKTFYSNPAILAAIENAKTKGKKLHLMGLVSNGSVHSSIDHLFALLNLLKEHGLKEVYLHAILDGRDTSYKSGAGFLRSTQRTMEEYGVGRIATVAGRFYTMDRNNNWDRTAKAYLAMTQGIGNQTDDPIKAVELSYKKKIYDEEFLPTVITDNGQPIGKIGNGDSLIFFNFRPDRARQITKAFVIKDLDRFERPEFLSELFYVAFTEYEKNLPVKVAFVSDEPANTLGEVISQAGLKQLRIAETEKYAHVTYFFNGGKEDKSPGEEHMLVPSPAVDSYDKKPEMSAVEVTSKVLDAVNKEAYDFILINYANADMVGHTSNITATVTALEMLDKLLGKVVKAVLEKDGVVLITADHGNAEIMFDMQTGMPDKEHSTNPVPFILVGKEYEGKNYGWPDAPSHDLSLITPRGILSDVAPTILKILGIEQPKEITGRPLI